MPVLEVESSRLCGSQISELLVASFRAEFTGLQVLAPQDRIHMLQPRTLETEADCNPQQLVGIGLD